MVSTEKFQQMSSGDFAAFGLSHIAYVRPIKTDDGEVAFAIHAADGRPVAVMADREVAFAAIRQNDLEPVSVH
ncbi:MAG TPA: DUF1150 family protein [Alphaproteobacteria bacterium]|jgi:hypothetical protein